MNTTEKKSKKIKKEHLVVIVICLIVVVLLIIGIKFDFIKKDSEINSESYVSGLEGRVSAILSSIDGVGKSKVMITVDCNETTDKSGYFNESSTSSKNSAVVGVVIVCEGANNIMVKEVIAESVTTLLGVPFEKIQIFKMKK